MYNLSFKMMNLVFIMMNLVFIMMNSQAAPRSRVPPPLSEDVQKRLYGPGKDLVGFRRKMAMDKAHVCVGFGSSSPPRAGPGSREVETDERAFGAGWTVITGVATKREGGEEAAPASPEQEPVKFVAVAVRKAPPKAGAGLRRLDAAGHAKREKQRFPAKPQPPPLAGAKSPVESAAGTELLGIIADAHNAISSKRPAVTGLRSHQAAAKASEPGPEPEPEPEPKSEPVPEPAAEAEVLSPRVARVDDVGGAGMYRVLASATVRESPDATSKKVGEFKKGAVIDVVHAQTNAQGVTVFQTVTVPSGKKRGGWVKLETSKEPSPTPHSLEQQDALDRTAADAPAVATADVLSPQPDEVEPESDEEPSPLPSSTTATASGALIGTRVAAAVDEKVRKAILGEKIASTTEDEVVLDDEQVDAVDDDSKTSHVAGAQPEPETSSMISSADSQEYVVNRELDAATAELMAGVDSMDSDDLLSKMEGWLDFDSAASAVGPALDSTTAWETHYAETGAAAAEPESEPALEPQPEPEPNPEPEVLSPRAPEAQQLVVSIADIGGPGMYRVLASATVRESPDATSKKVGEFKKGAVIDVVHAQTNAQGVTVFQTVTVPSGKKRGGWVKPETSKGKPLLERVPSPTPQEPAHEEPTVHAHVAAVGGGSKEDATAAACEWLADKGHADAVGQTACSALAAAEMPCGEWIQELESMDSEGILVAFLGSLKNMPVAADFARSRSPSPSTEPEKPLDLEPASSSVRSSTVTISVMCPLNHKPGQPVKIETDHGTVTVPAPAGIEAGDMFDAEVEVLTAGGSDSLTTVAAGELSGGSLDDLYDQLQATVSPTSVTADDSQAPAAETKLTPSPRASLAESQPSDDYEDDGGAARPDMDIGKWLDEIGANGSIEDAFLDADINTLEDLSNVISTPADLEKYLPSTDLVKLGWLEVARIRREEGTHMSSRATEAANLLAVVCPEGVSAGEKVVVEGPDGQDIDAMVPEGVVAGQTFEVDIGAVGTLVSVSSGPTMTVTVPAGCAGGDIIAITVSDGQELQVRVPDGVDEGEEFECAT